MIKHKLITPQSKILEFFKQYPELTYSKGEKILRPNEYSEHMYLVKSGYIRMYKRLQSGQEITFSRNDPKRQRFILFGYLPLLVDYHIEAFTDIVLHRAPKTDFQQFSEKNPDVRDYIDDDLQIIIEELITQIEWLSIPDAYTRIKAILYSLARMNRGLDNNNKLKLDNRTNPKIKITHKLIASFAGLSRETVTIQINKLISEGYLSRIGNSLRIEDIDSLRKAIS